MVPTKLQHEVGDAEGLDQVVIRVYQYQGPYSFVQGNSLPANAPNSIDTGNAIVEKQSVRSQDLATGHVGNAGMG